LKKVREEQQKTKKEKTKKRRNEETKKRRNEETNNVKQPHFPCRWQQCPAIAGVVLARIYRTSA
jgi:hypothetical protein